MENELIKFLSKYIDLSEGEIETVIELNLIRKYNKGALLLHAGEVSQECYFVLEGCLRSYYLIDGEEKTTAFYTESQVATPVSYTTRAESDYYVSCLENCILCVGTPEKSAILVKRIPKLEAIGHVLNSESTIENRILFDNYLTMTPEKRYLNLLETRPDLCNRVPQYHLASYLGIKPESLSRIRKRIVMNKP
jgi:CRP-like cAMP-binding protein